MHFFPEGEALEQKEGAGAQNLARKRGRCSRGAGPGGPRATRRPGLRRGPVAAPPRGRQSGVAMGGASMPSGF